MQMLGCDVTLNEHQAAQRKVDLPKKGRCMYRNTIGIHTGCKEALGPYSMLDIQ